jgi:hypothetical protein
MRRLTYFIALSIDAFIARPNDEVSSDRLVETYVR